MDEGGSEVIGFFGESCYLYPNLAGKQNPMALPNWSQL